MIHLVSRLLRVTATTMVAVTAALALAILTPGAAQAQVAPYAPDGAPTLSDGTPAPGESISVTGDGFRAGSLVRVVIFSEPVVLGTAKADAAGEVDIDVAIPISFTPGSEHHIELQGVNSSGEIRILSQEVTLAGGEGLPRTGAVIVPILVLGLVLLVGGGALVASGRKRRSVN